MPFEIKPATRQGVRPLIAFYGESGSGKTMSALLLARGMAGATGKVVVMDTEAGRGGLYADVIPGGYDVMQIAAPFAPKNMIEAMVEIEKYGATVGVIDSGSHEWEGIGGVNDMASENEDTSGRPGLHNWRKPKMEHALWVLKLQQSSIPWIICIRAKFKTHQKKDAAGKTFIFKDEFISPIQSDDFIFEMTAHLKILSDHKVIVTKCSHPDLRPCLPDDDASPITVRHGEMIASWCRGDANPSADLAALKKQLMACSAERAQHGGKPGPLKAWLVGQALLDPAVELQTLDAAQLKFIIRKIGELK